MLDYDSWLTSPSQAEEEYYGYAENYDDDRDEGENPSSCAECGDEDCKVFQSRLKGAVDDDDLQVVMETKPRECPKNG